MSLFTETGKPLDMNNFRRLIWTPALKKVGVSYRYSYQCRHTFATNIIEQNRNPLWIANQMGTSLEMLFEIMRCILRSADGHKNGHTGLFQAVSDLILSLLMFALSRDRDIDCVTGRMLKKPRRP